MIRLFDTQLLTVILSITSIHTLTVIDTDTVSVLLCSTRTAIDQAQPRRDRSLSVVCPRIRLSRYVLLLCLATLRYVPAHISSYLLIRFD